MLVEWLIIVPLLLGVAWILLGRGAGRAVRWVGAAFLMAGLAGVWGWQTRLEAKLASRTALSAPHVGRPDEYAGSESCRTCHPDPYASWHRSYHRTMTQIASPESVRGNFANVDLELDGQRYHLERRGEEYWVEMVDPEWTMQEALGAGLPALAGASAAELPRASCRITMLTGSHHMQAYWVDNQHGNQQYSFPFIYLFEEERWVPRRSAFIRDPDARRWIQIWNVGCINCHATAGQPRQAEDGVGFDTRVAELGIACEACHGPAAEHVQLNADPGRRYGLHFQGHGDSSIINPARLSSKLASDVCGRCHSIHAAREDREWLERGESFRPGQALQASMRVHRTMRSAEARRASFWNDGMVRVSGREYNGLIRTPCYERGELSCLSCHSMHRSDPDDQLAEGMGGNAACLQCHAKVGENVERHTHHAPGSSGSLCYNCHMPFTTYGLLKALRSHQISSPSVRESLRFGRPNACNLCHLDQTLGWTEEHLSSWYGMPREQVPEEEQSIAASLIWALKGDAGQRALIAWHMGWDEARKTSGTKWMPPALAVLLNDPYPAVRFLAGRSLKSIPGFGQFAYDHLANPETWARSSEAALHFWSTMERKDTGPSLLLEPDGSLRQQAVAELLRARDNRVVLLNE